jgi:hypothetical protein
MQAQPSAQAFGAPTEVARHLRVAALWGDTILGSAVLAPGQSFAWPATVGVQMPDHVPPIPVRGVAGAWEIDPRGASSGFLRLRGRDEDVSAFAKAGAPIGLLPGDVVLLQYGALSFFAQPAVGAPPLPSDYRFEPFLVLAFALSSAVIFGGLYAARELATPTPIPEPLELLDDRTLKDQLHAELDEKEEKPKPDSADGSGVKDPGLKDKQAAAPSKRMANAEGKLGQKDAKGETRLPGERPGVPAGSLTDVLGSGAGAALSDTLNSMASVSQLTGGLKASDLQWGGGSGGMGFKGGGSGGGGTGPGGVPYGAGNVGAGFGGKGGPGGGRGGGGPGGAGGGGGGPGGEKKISAVQSSGGGSKNFSADEIRRVVMSHQGQIRACYENALESSPGLRGSVSVSWHISASGAVTRASVGSSTIGNGRVEGCLTRVIKGWSFRNPDGVEAEASWGWQFSPPG